MTYNRGMKVDGANAKDLGDEIGKTKSFQSPEQEAFLNIVRTHELLVGEFERLFKKHGLSDPQYNALRILRGHGKPLPVYTVAEQMVTREPDITRLVDRLEQGGFVARQRSNEDRRVVLVELTTAGKAVLKKLDGPVRKLHQAQLGHMGRRRLTLLNELLFESRRPR